jgi:hypothetical protein
MLMVNEILLRGATGRKDGDGPQLNWNIAARKMKHPQLM